MKNAEKMQDLLSIGTVAKSYGVSDNCIRRMEAAGLLKPAYISPQSGYRYYDRTNIYRIGTVLSLKSFGFVNAEIREYFKHSGDYSVMFSKLLKKQFELNQLVDRMSRLLKGTGFHCEIVDYEASCYYTKKVHFVPSLAVLAELSGNILYEAVRSGFSVEYTRPILLNTNCMDYKEFRSDLPQEVTICLPLKKPVEGSASLLIPTEKMVACTWSYPGQRYQELLPLLNEVFDSKKLTQINTLRASYDIGGYTGSEHTIEDTVMHILVPVK